MGLRSGFFFLGVLRMGDGNESFESGYVWLSMTGLNLDSTMDAEDGLRLWVLLVTNQFRTVDLLELSRFLS